MAAKLIRLPGYRPQLLGDTEEKALAGFLRRMDGLIAYSKERGDRCRPLVLADKRAEVEPIVLESALETSRVVADLLHTIGRLVPVPSSRSHLPRSIGKPEIGPVGNPRLPIKVVLLGTKFSTLRDEGSHFVFHNLPVERGNLVAFRDGKWSLRTEVRIADLAYTGAGALVVDHWQPNLVRNSDFEIRWLSKDAPDCWYPTKTAWEGDLIPLKDGARYALRLNWQAQPGPGDVVLRFRQNTNLGLPPVDAAFKPGTAEHAFTGSEKMKWAQILIRTTNAPTSLLKSIAITPEH